MLFNSQTFIFLFLPLVFIVFVALSKAHCGHWIKSFLVCASIFFYAWWKIDGLWILGVSLGINFLLGRAVIATQSRRVLIFGLLFNLSFLFFFKYTDFLIENSNALFNTHFPLIHVLLPLGISFFTFQKIAFLVDAYQGKVKKVSFQDYAFFVTFFPQLIAGPIVHHSEIIPQLKPQILSQVNYANIATGFSLFVVGLFKKVIIADHAARIANDLFNAKEISSVDAGVALFGVLGYTIQIYFDFSGYSDMALGLAKIFNITLPINFNSPYQSFSIVEFWRRWHMSLSRFLRDYLYIPLGGSRRGKIRRYLNLFLTMLIGGFWHGAS